MASLRADKTDFNSLIVKKWPMPPTNTVQPEVQPSKHSNPIIEEAPIKNISINGRTLPLKVLKLIPGSQMTQEGNNL